MSRIPLSKYGNSNNDAPLAKPLCRSIFNASGPQLMGLPAQALVTDLSKNEVAIETNFTGESVLLFGAIEQVKPDAQDIVVIIKRARPSPDRASQKPKFRHLDKWRQTELSKSTSYYAVASTRKLSEIAPTQSWPAMPRALIIYPSPMRATNMASFKNSSMV